MNGSRWQRFTGRVRHGLLAQEILDRLGKIGLLCQPYIVTFEACGLVPAPPAPDNCSVRPLNPGDADSIAAVGHRRRTAEQIHLELQDMRCYGAFLEQRLIGYTWVNLRYVPVVYRGGELFAIASDEAYLFDMFIDPAHRGLRIAPWLRVQVLAALANEGRVRCYSLSLLLNRSSRLFKARLGAQEREWRLSLQVGLGPLRGIDLRLARRGEPLRTPTLLTRPPWRAHHATE